MSELAAARDLLAEGVDVARAVLGNDHPHTKTFERGLHRLASA